MAVGAAQGQILNIIQSPKKLAIAGAAAGLVMGQFSSITQKGDTPTPTVGGTLGSAIFSGVKGAVFSGVIGAALAAMARENVVQGAKNGAVIGAIFGASAAGGRAVSNGIAGTIGY